MQFDSQASSREQALPSFNSYRAPDSDTEDDREVVEKSDKGMKEPDSTPMAMAMAMVTIEDHVDTWISNTEDLTVCEHSDYEDTQGGLVEDDGEEEEHEMQTNEVHHNQAEHNEKEVNGEQNGEEYVGEEQDEEYDEDDFDEDEVEDETEESGSDEDYDITSPTYPFPPEYDSDISEYLEEVVVFRDDKFAIGQEVPSPFRVY
jgi:hypothetical protein